MKYPEMHHYIKKHMAQAEITSNIALMKRINKVQPMGHEFVRIIVNGEALPEVDNAKAMAKAMGADPLEFLILIENCRLKKRGLHNLMCIVPCQH